MSAKTQMAEICSEKARDALALAHERDAYQEHLVALEEIGAGEIVLMGLRAKIAELQTVIDHLLEREKVEA